MNRGCRRWNVFHDLKDKKYFLDLLADVSRIWKIEIHAYSLMDNHYHLLIRTPEPCLSKSLRHVASKYTQYYNQKYQKDGPLFRGRFKSILVEDGFYLRSLLRYIHLNPVAAGLCAEPQSHLWTSHHAYLDEKKKPEFLVTETMLKKFGDDLKTARKRLNDYIADGRSLEAVEMERIMARKRPVSFLGSIGFKDWIRDNLLDSKPRTKTNLYLRRERRQAVGIRHILNFVRQQYGCKLSDVKTAGSGKKNEARAMAAFLLREINGMTHIEIARVVGGASAVAISKLLLRFAEKIKADVVLDEKIKVYKRNLMSRI